MSATKTKKSATKTAKPKAAKGKAKPAKSAKPKDGKLSALDAAAKVLASAGEPMTTKEMIEAMAAKGLWMIPNGAPQTALCIQRCFVRQTRRRG